MSKECTKCGIIKELDEFYNSKAHGKTHWCKECLKENCYSLKATYKRVFKERDYGNGS